MNSQKKQRSFPKNKKNPLVFFSVFIKTWFFRFLGLFIRRHDDYFAFGSWAGDHFADNAKYLCLFINKHYPSIHIFWFGNERVSPSVHSYLPKAIFIQKNCFKGYVACLKCGVFIFDHHFEEDISNINLIEGAVSVSLGHGIPLKKYDMSRRDYKKPSLAKKFMLSMICYYPQSDFYVVCSPEHAKCDLASRDCRKTHFLESGYPRNDYLFRSDLREKERVVKKYSSMLGISPNRRIILYAPTFRFTGHELKTLLDLPKDTLDSLTKMLASENAVIVEKTHYASENQTSVSRNNETIFQIGQDLEVDFQELLVASDCLIGDYSGAILDYLILDRPELLFAYDYDFYSKCDSGLFYSLKEFSFGPIVTSSGDLVSALKKILAGEDDYHDARKAGRERFLSFEKGNACETIYKTVKENL